MRLVSLCPSNTEILFALGLGPQVVAVDDWSDWPDEVIELPRVGPDLRADLGRVAALEPDLVIASLSVPGMERNVEGLRERGLPHLVLDPHSLDDVLKDIERVGEACGIRGRALSVVQEARGRIERVCARASGRPKRRLYWEWWPKPLIVAGARSWVDQMSDLVGGRNVFGGIDAPSAAIEPDEVVSRDPELLLICWCGTLQRLQEPSRIARRPGWDRIAGVAAGRVHCVSEALFGRPSQRLIDGLELLNDLVARTCPAGVP
jgi:iron complex transport system substrate-binding protein